MKTLRRTSKIKVFKHNNTIYNFSKKEKEWSKLYSWGFNTIERDTLKKMLEYENLHKVPK